MLSEDGQKILELIEEDWECCGDTDCPQCTFNRKTVKPFVERALAEINARQAKIDTLMLEYCPDEMSKEQIEEWGEHQKVAELSPELEEALKPENLKKKKFTSAKQIFKHYNVPIEDCPYCKGTGFQGKPITKPEAGE